MRSWYAQVFQVLEERDRQEEEALGRKIADSVPDPRISSDNWARYCRAGYFICPASRGDHACSEKSCTVGLQCRQMHAIGLLGTGEIISKKDRVRCGAKTRAGGACKMAVLPGKRRCRLHGGLSTGPKSPEGKERVAAAQRKRWADRRERIERATAAHRLADPIQTTIAVPAAEPRSSAIPADAPQAHQQHFAPSLIEHQQGPAEPAEVPTKPAKKWWKRRKRISGMAV